MSLREDIHKAVEEAGIEGFAFVRVAKWEGLLHRIAEAFLRRGVRDLESVWLWNEFKDTITSEHPSDSLSYLRDQLRAEETYWFIASDEHGKYWVADASGDGIVRTIGEMYGFEYYVIHRNLDWILSENHHGVFVKAARAGTRVGE